MVVKTDSVDGGDDGHQASQYEASFNAQDEEASDDLVETLKGEFYCQANPVQHTGRGHPDLNSSKEMP
jgi:hypothetical protein